MNDLVDKAREWWDGLDSQEQMLATYFLAVVVLTVGVELLRRGAADPTYRVRLETT